MQKIIPILVIMWLLFLCSCDYSSYNSRIYADGSQWTGVGTISVLSIKDRQIKDMALRDGSRLGAASTKSDPDDEAIAKITNSLFDIIETWMAGQPKINAEAE